MRKIHYQALASFGVLLILHGCTQLAQADTSVSGTQPSQPTSTASSGNSSLTLWDFFVAQCHTTPHLSYCSGPLKVDTQAIACLTTLTTHFKVTQVDLARKLAEALTTKVALPK